MLKKLILIFFIGLIFLSCGEGIAPEPEGKTKTTGFGGILVFKGKWPEGIKRTHIVAFRKPLNSVGDFNAFNLGFVSDSILYGSKSMFYNSNINPLLEIIPGEYSYVAVAQSRTPEISINRKDWYVIGVYYGNGDKTSPAKLIIPKDEYVTNINITCDFDNPPTQPPGGD